jgi:hypothetical protein
MSTLIDLIVWMCACVCMCVRVRLTRNLTRTHTHGYSCAEDLAICMDTNAINKYNIRTNT